MFSPKVEYVRLHVTLVATTSNTVLPERLNLKPGTHVGKFVLTTANHDGQDFSTEGDRRQNIGPKPDFNSISYHQTIDHNGQKEHIWKVFSMDRKSDKWLEEVFGKGTVGWIHRKVVRTFSY